MLTQTELKNVLFFLTNGKWNLSYLDAVELAALTKKVDDLTKVPEETKPKTKNVSN